MDVFFEELCAAQVIEMDRELVLTTVECADACGTRAIRLHRLTRAARATPPGVAAVSIQTARPFLEQQLRFAAAHLL